MGTLNTAQRQWLEQLGELVGKPANTLATQSSAPVVNAAAAATAPGGSPPQVADGHDDPRFAPLLGGARKLGQNLQGVRDRLEEQVKINADQWAVAGVSKAAGTVGRLFSSAAHKVGHAISDNVDEEEFHAVATPDRDIFDAAETDYVRFQTAVGQGDFQAAGTALKAYAKAIDSAKARVDDFLQGVGSGAEGATTVLKGTAVAGAVAATVATGGVAGGAAVPMLGIAASSSATVLGTATAVGLGAGAYGVAQEGAGQATERLIGTRSEIDFEQIALRGAKDAAIGFVGAFVGGVLAKQFARMFGSYLSEAITAEELAAIGNITNNGVPLARDAFLSTGQRLVTDFLAGAGTTPLTTAIAVVAGRISGKALPSTDEFAHLVLEEFIRGSALQLFIGAVTHGAGGGKPHGEGTVPEPSFEPRTKLTTAPREQAASTEPLQGWTPEVTPHAANNDVELPPANDKLRIAANDNAEVGASGQQQQEPMRMAVGAAPMSEPPQASVGAGQYQGGATTKQGHRELNPRELLRAASNVKHAEKLLTNEQEFLAKNLKRKLSEGPPEAQRPPELEGELKKLPKLDQPDERAAAIRELLERQNWSDEAVSYLKELERRADSHAHNEAVDSSGRAKETAETSLALAKDLLRQASVTIKQSLRKLGPNYKNCISAKPFDEALGPVAFAKLSSEQRALSPDHVWSLDRIANSGEMTKLFEVYSKLQPGSAQRQQMLKEIAGIGDVKENLASMRRDANRDWKKEQLWSELNRAEGMKRYAYDNAAFGRALGLEKKAIEAVRKEIARIVAAYGSG